MRMTLTMVCAAGLFCAQASGALTSIGPFSGAASEGFESMALGGIDGVAPNESDPVSILGGAGLLSGVNTANFDPIYVWNSIGGLSLGIGVTATPYDGTQGITLQTNISLGAPTARIDFIDPVMQFGGYWAHADYQGNAGPIDLTFYDSSGGVIGTDSFHYDFAGLQGVLEWFGWESTTAIAAVEWTGYYATLDGIQINVPAPAGSAALVAGLCAGLGASGRRRRG